MTDRGQSEPAFLSRTFDEIAVGEEADLTRTVSNEDLQLAALIGGGLDPTAPMLRPAPGQGYASLFCQGLLIRVVSQALPGPGSRILTQSFRSNLAPRPGAQVTAVVRVVTKRASVEEIDLDCRCVDASGQVFLTGQLTARPPATTHRTAGEEAPSVWLNRHERFHTLLRAAQSGAPLTAAVAYPCEAHIISAVREAADAGLIFPMLVGPKSMIAAAAKEANVDISAYPIVDARDSEAAAAASVGLITAGEAELLMKGSLHTDEILHATLAPEAGLRLGRRLSHVYLMDAPLYPRPLFITDAAVNIAPDLQDKRDIVQNAIDLAHAMGIPNPKVAILSAVEVVNPKIQSTLDAAALCKMADRGQIHGGILDGPLAFDNAVSADAAAEKGIVSPVAGAADILVAPNLEAGNILAKQLTFLSGADAAGVVLGARVPIILTSRADIARTRLASCAVAVLLGRHQTSGPQAHVKARHG